MYVALVSEYREGKCSELGIVFYSVSDSTKYLLDKFIARIENKQSKSKPGNVYHAHRLHGNSRLCRKYRFESKTMSIEQAERLLS